jgi:hypothetical protein
MNAYDGIEAIVLQVYGYLPAPLFDGANNRFHSGCTLGKRAHFAHLEVKFGVMASDSLVVENEHGRHALFAVKLPLFPVTLLFNRESKAAPYRDMKNEKKNNQFILQRDRTASQELDCKTESRLNKLFPRVATSSSPNMATLLCHIGDQGKLC